MLFVSFIKVVAVILLYSRSFVDSQVWPTLDIFVDPDQTSCGGLGCID